MLGKLLTLLTGVTLIWTGCSSGSPDIRAICVRDNIGNYVIKWETNPLMEGSVKVEVSENANRFNGGAPVITANIRDGVATYITTDNLTPKYFRLTFNDRYARIIGARPADMDSVQNLRDMGGYHTADGRTVKWGKVFRSGQLSSLSEWDSLRLRKLGIKTIIDLRTPRETQKAPSRTVSSNLVQIPVSVGKTTDVIQKVIDQRMRKGDAQIFMEDEYLQFVTRNSDSFAKALELFEDKENYPILVCCSYGKDRTGFLSAMLLAALDVPREEIMEDYLSSNQGINTNHLMSVARDLPSEAQESITVFLTADEALMDLAFQRIKKEYGSLDKYLSKGLRLSDEKREKLRDILLY